MGVESVVSVLGIIVATVVSVWTYRRMNPKRQLRYRVEVTPLLIPDATAGGRLTIALDGTPVTSPQIVTLSLWSSGRADISSHAFDGGDPLTFDLGAPIIEELPGNHAAPARLEAELPDKLILRPSLLHRRFASTIRVIVDGTPEVRTNHVLADIDVVRDGVNETARAIDTSRRRLRATPLVVSTGALALGLVILIIGLVVYSFDAQAYLPWGTVGVLLMMAALVAIVVIAVYRLIRWAGRNIEARSGLR